MALSIVNPNPQFLEGPEYLHHLLSKHHDSSDVAIEHTDASNNHTSITYKQLHGHANALAAKLLSLKPKDVTQFIVPIFIQQSLELYISQLAILKAGGAFCPVPLDVPEDRLRFILEDVEATLLLTSTTRVTQLPNLNTINIVTVDNATSTIHNAAPKIPLKPSQPAYVMYTSGSTGKPKGVLLSHSAAAQALLAHDRHIPPFQRFLQFANPTFDVSVFEIFFPLFRGATLVTCDRRKLLDDLPGVINRLKIDAAELTPSVASSLLHDRASVPSLKVLLTIGEMLKKSVVEEFGGSSSQTAILHGMYGPTEATIHCTLQPSFQKDMSVGNIGIPLDTTSAFVVKPASESDPYAAPEILPIGEEGELAVGGYQLADGYIKREEQTKAAFVRHPDHGRLYRTGDRAKLMPDGTLECLGRISSGQVKLRGQRIELGEIEHAATQAQGCRTVVADVLDGALVTFCVLSDPATTTDDIRQSCRKWLPAFMVPNDIVVLDALPYLSSGKVDRRALKAQYAEIKTECGPATELSTKGQEVASVLTAVLGTDVSGNTSLTMVGLDSLSAIRLASAMRKAGLPQLDAATILEARTIADLENALGQSEAANISNDPETSALLEEVLSNTRLAGHRNEIEGIYAATAVQSAMLAETVRKAKAYCNWIKLRLCTNDNLKAVETALHQLAQHHGMIRTGFTAVTTGYANVVWKSLDASQIQRVTQFEHAFAIETDQDLLRPCHFQLLRRNDDIEVLIQLHHALYDQWSIDLLKRDLELLLRGQDAETASPFSSVSTYHSRTLQSDRDRLTDFWQAQLQDYTPTLIPQLNGRKVEEQSSRTPWTHLNIDASAIKYEARSKGYSVPALFQAAYAYVLNLYAGSQDVLFGTVFSGRNIPVPDVEDIVGPCLATLPSRIDIASAQTAIDLVRSVHDTNRQLQRHAILPLAEIKAAAHCSPGAVLFDSLFIWQESIVSTGGEAVVQEIESEDRTEFNLVLEFEPKGTHVAARATYQEQILPKEHAQMLLAQIESIVRTIIERPDLTISKLSDKLLQEVSSICNPTPSYCSPQGGFIAEIERQADESPERLAIEFATSLDKSPATAALTYLQLNQGANQLAHYLIRAGVKPNDVVGVWMEKSINLYIAMLAVLKAGAGYLPLLPETPNARVKSAFSQAKVRYCIADSGLRVDLPLQSIVMTDLDLRTYSTSNPNIDYVGSNIAYAVFTSGSTGEPKGVAVTFENLSGNLAALAELYSVRPGDRLLQQCSQAFDVSVFEIFFAFSTGMCLCSATKERLFRDLEHSIRSLDITHLSMTPTVAALVDPKNIPSVRFLVTAGEPLTDTVQRKWAGRGLHQGYGPSETTNICSVHMDFPTEHWLGDLGPPLCNTSVFVISTDAEFQILPKGALGELAFGGEQVFRGYIGRDDLNSVKLLKHPQHGLLYRSGDMARMLHDGSMFFSGRQDDQVKIRGNRIELGEITSVLMQDAKVIDCTTAVYGDESVGQSIICSLVLKHCRTEGEPIVSDAGQSDIDRLFNTLENNLPTYMVPSMLVPMSRMPLTTQGKLDRRFLKRTIDTLSDAQKSRFSRDATHDEDEIGKWSDEERTIAAALATRLETPVENVGRTTSFYAFGLNSLAAIGLSKALEEQLHARVSVDMILRNSSVKRLAACIGRGSSGASKRTKSTIEVFDKTWTAKIKRDVASQALTLQHVLPCTPLQDAMLATGASSDSGAYSNSTLFKLFGDVIKVQRVWQQLVDRHAILRTHFVETASSEHPFAQVVVKEAHLRWITVSSQEEVKDATMSQPFRATVYSNGNGTFLDLRMHHAIYDGNSMSILLHEAECLFRDESLSPPTSFAEFIAETDDQQSEEALKFWRRQFSNFQPKPFPRSESHQHTNDEKTFRGLLAASVKNIDEFCKRHSVTPLSLFQAAWAKTLHLLQDAEDICFGNVVSGRSAAVAGIETLVAPCFNTVPIRVTLDRINTNLNLVRSLHQQNIEGVDYQLTALRRIQVLSKTPQHHLFDSMLLVQPPQEQRDASIWKFVSESGTMDLPLVIEVVPQSSNYAVHVHHTTEKVSQLLAKSLTNAFIAAVSSCVRYSSSSVADLLSFDIKEITGRLAPSTKDLVANEGEAGDGSSGEWNSTESTVRDVLASLAKVAVNKVGRQTSMYRLGLDSLNAAQIAAQLRARGLQVDAAGVIANPTPSGIASTVGTAAASPVGEQVEFNFESYHTQQRSKIDLDDSQIEAIRPCTAVQCGMIGQSLDTEGALYVNHVTFSIPASVAVKDVKHAWAAVQRKHQALRVGFFHVGGQQPFGMVVHSSSKVQPGIIEHDASTDKDVEATVAAAIVDNLIEPGWRVTMRKAGAGLHMMLSLHHALYDADSLQLLLRDFEAALEGKSIGQAVNMDRLLASILQPSSTSTEQTKTFWHKALEGSNFIKFPNLAPLVVEKGSMCTVVRSSSIARDALDEFCKSHSVTTQAIGQTAWAQLLAAYTGEPQVLFGTVLSARSSPEDQDVVFPCITTIPVSCDTSEKTDEIVQDMLRYNASAQRYRFAPLSDIQRYADRAGQALFDTVFVYQKTSPDQFSWNLVRETAAVDYAVSLELELPQDGSIKFRLTAMNDQVPERHADMILQQYDYILSQIINPRLETQEFNPSLYAVTPAKEPKLPSPVTLLHEFLERGAEKHPEKLAFEFIDEINGPVVTSRKWSYKQVDDRSNQVAQLLQKYGVKKGGIIAVCMEKSPEVAFAFEGILKAGCSYLAMDPELPAARHKFILEDSSSALLFVSPGCDMSDSANGVRIVELTESLLDGYSTDKVKIGHVDPSETSYNLYTSGTTGTPKGCQLSHENALQFLVWFQRLFSGHWDENSRWCQFASYWFDVSMLEHFWSWGVGIACVGAPRDLMLEDIGHFIRTANITHIDLTPSLARLLTPEDVPSLVGHVFITGGEALKQEIIDSWGPVNTICNGYGPTETSCGVTMLPFVGADAKPSNIGPQFDNVGTYVLEPGSEDPVLRGAVGELCISGVLVGKGYLNRPEQTAKAFPTLKANGERIYRTGDLVRILHDGSFSFIGRKDTQAKLRGQRLEIGEIDNVIKASSTDINEVTSLVAKSGDGGGRETLVSFISTGVGRKNKELALERNDGARSLVSQADEACRTRLPPYMVPTHILPMPFMPLTVNNKVDSKKLVALYNSLSVKELQQLKGSSSESGPLSQSEQKICAALGSMLQLETAELSRDANVFSLGLSSVSAISLANVLKKEGFTNASVNTIMRNPTIGRLAKSIGGQDAAKGAEHAAVRQAQLSISAFSQRWCRTAANKLGISADSVESISPCTPLQEGLVLDSIRKAERPYFNEFRYSLGEVDIDRLQNAFNELVKAVEVLRTAVVQTDDGYAQVVRKSVEVQWTTVDNDKEIDTLKAQWLDANAQDLVQPLQVVLQKASKTLVFHVHHCTYDGISWQLLLDCLAEIYEKGADKIDVGPRFSTALPSGPLSSPQDAKSFWQSRLAGEINGELEVELAVETTKDTIASIEMHDTSKIEAVRKELGVSHQALLQACFEVAIHQQSPKTTLYGHVVSGRSIPLDGADKVIGPLFNTIPVPLDLDSSDTWTDLVKRLQDANVSVIPYHHTPLRSIRKWLKTSPTDQLFDVLFVFQHESTPANNNLWKPVENPLIADYPLAFEVSLHDDNHLTVNVVAEGRTADENAVQTLLENFERALSALISVTDQKVADTFAITAQAKQRSTGKKKNDAAMLNGVHDFEWTKQASDIRKAITQLAGLDLEEVDEHSTIFSLGLDSIDAVKLGSRLKKANLPIPVSKIIQAQTIPRLLQAVDASARPTTSADSPNRLQELEPKLNRYVQSALSKKTNIERVLPATPNQEALIADMLRSDFADYYNHDVLRMDSVTDVEKMISAWQTVIDQSPILRTGFLEVDDPEIPATFVQVIHKPSPVYVEKTSLQNLAELAKIQSKVTEDAKSASQQAVCPLRLNLASIGSDQYLLISIAHAQYDGHSLALIHEDVQRAYHNSYEPRPSYDSIIEDALTGTDDDARQFWRNMLSDVKRSTFPVADIEEENNVVNRTERTASISADQAKSLCQKTGCSLQALAQTCWALVLAHYSRSLEVSFGSVQACRDSEEAEEVLFPTMNTVVMRVSLHGSRLEMLQHMQGTINEMLPYQRTPLRTIQAAAGVTDLFNTLFIYQHRPEAPSDASKPLYESVSGSSSVDYPVASEMEAIGNKLIFRTACKASALDTTGAKKLLNRMDEVLKSIVRGPEEPTITFSGAATSICGLPEFQQVKALEVKGADQENDALSTAELTPVASAIRLALAQVAKIPEDFISPTTTIESIGIDSISTIKVTGILRKKGISLSVSQMIKARTISKMAEIASSKDQSSEKSQESSIEAVQAVVKQYGLRAAVKDMDAANIETVLPATAGQIYMMNVWQKTEGQLFHPSFDYQVDSSVSISKLEEAWRALVQHHPLLRSLLLPTDSDDFPMVQVVLKHVTSSFSTQDTLPVVKPWVYLQARQVNSGISLKLTIHHALYDGVSIDIIMADFQRILNEHALRPTSISQEDFLALSITKDAQSKAKHFWSNYLADVRPASLPQPNALGAQPRVELFKPALSTQIGKVESTARKAGVTFHALLFAVYAKVYAGLTSKREQDVVLGIYLSNRSQLPNLLELASPTLNLVPLLVRSPESTTIVDIAKQIHKDLNNINTPENSAVGLWQIKQWTGVVVDTFVNLIKFPESDDTNGKTDGIVLQEVDEYKTDPYARVSQPAKAAASIVPQLAADLQAVYQYSLDLEATISKNGELGIGLFCPEDMVSLDQAKAMVSQLKELFESIV